MPARSPAPWRTPESWAVPSSDQPAAMVICGLMVLAVSLADAVEDFSFVSLSAWSPRCRVRNVPDMVRVPICVGMPWMMTAVSS